MQTFETLLGKENPILTVVRERGFEKPSEIQEKAIPSVLAGNDVIAGASTGSGKTLAFAAGVIKNARKDYGIQGLILTPTRELAEQVARELDSFAHYKELTVVSIYGGVSMSDQTRKLPNAEIVVGTPGRIIDHLRNLSIDLKHVNTIVLDEADRMLDMGFVDDVNTIIEQCPKKRQTLLFSATISPDIVHIADRYLSNPTEIEAKPHVDPKKLTQIYYDIADPLKFSLLKHLLENEKAHLVMVFCNTRRNVDFLSENLKRSNLEVLPIHGGYSQDKRNKILSQFKNNKVNVLIATDVAARGLDISGVTHVYNYDIPPNKNEYTHRIGRTARAGKEGKVINILASRDYENFQNIMASDFPIVGEQPPYVKREPIQWIPQRNQQRGNGRYNNERGRGRSEERGESNGRYRGTREGNSRYRTNREGNSRTGNRREGNGRYGNNNRRPPLRNSRPRYR